MFIDYINKLRADGRRYFEFDQLVHDLGISVAAAKSGIYRLKKTGFVITPAKGLYIIVPPERQPYGCIPAEELVPILMNFLKCGYYVSLLSAASHYGATHQKASSFQVIANKRLKHNLEFGQVKIDLLYKKSLEKLPIKDITVSTGYLKIATPELVLFDLFMYRHQSGGLNHIATVLSELIESVNPTRLIALAKTIREVSWLQRLGYILEQLDTMESHKTEILIEKIAKYLEGKMKFYIPLASELPKAGFPYIEKWKIIANTEIESDI